MEEKNRIFTDNREANILNNGDRDNKKEQTEKELREGDQEVEEVNAEEGSKSDPQLTELDGLQKGGVEPHEDEDARFSDNDEKKGNDLNMPQFEK